MKRRLIIDIECKCNTIDSDKLQDHFDSMIEDIVYSMDELTYCYDDDSDKEHVVRTTFDHYVKEMD